MKKLTAQAIFDEAFPEIRPPRSAAYRLGVLNQLRYRMLEIENHKSPHAGGTAEADAYWAGVSEGWDLINKHGVDRRAKISSEAKSTNPNPK